MDSLTYFKFFISTLCLLIFGCKNTSVSKTAHAMGSKIETGSDTINYTDTLAFKKNIFDPEEYHKKVLALAHDSITTRWPVKTQTPSPGVILPFKRIVAYYGNFYSKNMGVLGALSEEDLITNLNKEVEKWTKSDSTTTVLPAIHYIAITAQSKPGSGNTYRLRMPEKEIRRAIDLGKKVQGITFLDVQVGHSKISTEVPTLAQYLSLPDVHLGIDPEWSMKDGTIPGKKIGTLDAEDINFAVDYLADIIKKYNLPPKILVVHRFTKGMITNSDKIKKVPDVQIVINMDGFGFAAKKIDSYKRFVSGFPVQFTGFKLFYKNDILTKPYRMMTPEEILNLYPKPIYIQYQ